ncbi:MAG: hypothetical protein PHW53_00060 [Patescibacteria group bacterium]|nr:hypothetical protein [Patescibacteria group bacterium]
MRTERETMSLEERAEAEKFEALEHNEKLKERIGRMSPEEIAERAKEIESRFHEIDALASDREKMEKTLGANAYKKLENEYLWLERERALLFIEKPIATAEQKIDEIEKAEAPIELAEPEIITAEPEEQAPRLIKFNEIKKTTPTQKIVKELNDVPNQVLKELKSSWQTVCDELKKNKQKPEIWWPGLKKGLEIVEVEELDVDFLPPAPPVPEAIPEEKTSVRINSVIEKFIKSQKEQFSAAETGWKEVGEQISMETAPERYKERNEKIRQTPEYQQFLKALNQLGRSYEKLSIKPRGGTLLLNFLDGVYRIGKPGSNLRKAGELIYEDILVGEVKMPVQEWEYQDRAQARAQRIDQLALLSGLTEEQERAEKEIKETRDYANELGQRVIFTASTERWAYLAAIHNLEVKAKTNEVYLGKINQALELEKKGQRKVELPPVEELFQVPAEWLDFPEITLDADEIWPDFPEIKIEKPEKPKETKKAA